MGKSQIISRFQERMLTFEIGGCHLQHKETVWAQKGEQAGQNQEISRKASYRSHFNFQPLEDTTRVSKNGQHNIIRLHDTQSGHEKPYRHIIIA